jgi:protein-disulfide isomerase
MDTHEVTAIPASSFGVEPLEHELMATPTRSMTLNHRRGRYRQWLGGVLAFAFLGAAVPVQASELDEIKETQKKILERLDAQDKTLKDILQKLQAQPQGAARPQIDPNKVYTIAVGTLPVRGPNNAPVTMYEFSDYQ